MKSLFLTFILLAIVYNGDARFEQDGKTFPLPSVNPSILGVFVGTTPCDNIVRPLHHIPLQDKCDQIKWKLTLYHDAATLTPSGYELTSTYGFHKDNRTYLTSGTNTSLKGEWKIVKGTKTKPSAVVYQLDHNKRELSLSFMRVDPNLLHLLNDDESLMVGNDACSYTLSRIQN
jgi:hypothetical protein